MTAGTGAAAGMHGGAAVGRHTAAVLGSPIAHSLSPVLHRAAYAALGLNWTYEAIECDEAGLPAALERLDETVVGWSLTMPLKRAILPYLDAVGPLAQAVGAVNTVVFDTDGPRRRLRGENTDVGGMVAAIRAVRPSAPAGDRVAVLGAGGTAAAALAAVRMLHGGVVVAVVRDPDRARDLLAAADRLGVAVELTRWPGLDAVRAAGLVISTVPAGATDEMVRSPVPWHAGQLVFDVVYDPWPTRLATTAEQAGAEVIGGLELLVRQAVLQIELWCGRTPPVELMRAAGRAALDARTG